jgi:nitroreductase
LNLQNLHDAKPVNENSDLLDTVLTLIHTRQYISPKRLSEPGPNEFEIKQIIEAAGAAPDHGQLTPWRLVIVPADKRVLLADAFANALVDRDHAATELQQQDAREKAYRGPFLMLVIARLGESLGETNSQERLISAGCAIQNMLLAAHALGYGSGLSSGKSLYSARIRELFHLTEDEQPICFVSIGMTVKHKSARIRPTMADYTTTL